MSSSETFTLHFIEAIFIIQFKKFRAPSRVKQGKQTPNDDTDKTCLNFMTSRILKHKSWS